MRVGPGFQGKASFAVLVPGQKSPL